MKRVRKGGSRMDETVKGVNGRMLKGNDVRKRWTEYFEELLNVEEDKKVVIVVVVDVHVPVIRDEI